MVFGVSAGDETGERLGVGQSEREYLERPRRSGVGQVRVGPEVV